jgi:hypothetical protein
MIIKLSLHYFPSILVDIVFCLKILLLVYFLELDKKGGCRYSDPGML